MAFLNMDSKLTNHKKNTIANNLGPDEFWPAFQTDLACQLKMVLLLDDEGLVLGAEVEPLVRRYHHAGVGHVQSSRADKLKYEISSIETRTGSDLPNQRIPIFSEEG